MRMRRMRNLEPRMEKCAAIRIAEPAALKGNWRSLKADAAALWVEVGKCLNSAKSIAFSVKLFYNIKQSDIRLLY